MQQFDGHLPCVREAKLLSYENIKHFDRMFESENKIKKPILEKDGHTSISFQWTS